MSESKAFLTLVSGLVAALKKVPGGQIEFDVDDYSLESIRRDFPLKILVTHKPGEFGDRVRIMNMADYETWILEDQKKPSIRKMYLK
jgi:hypothetical protein